MPTDKKKIAEPESTGRQINPDFDFNPKHLKPLQKALRSALIALGYIQSVSSTFNKIKSRTISPDGSLGGRGYVLSISDIRKQLMGCADTLSAITDTFYDEINAPHWKPPVEDDEIMQDVDDLREDPEDFVESEDPEAEGLGDEEDDDTEEMPEDEEDDDDELSLEDEDELSLEEDEDDDEEDEDEDLSLEDEDDDEEDEDEDLSLEDEAESERFTEEGSKVPDGKPPEFGTLGLNEDEEDEGGDEEADLGEGDFDEVGGEEDDEEEDDEEEDDEEEAGGDDEEVEKVKKLARLFLRRLV